MRQISHRSKPHTSKLLTNVCQTRIATCTSIQQEHSALKIQLRQSKEEAVALDGVAFDGLPRLRSAPMLSKATSEAMAPKVTAISCL